MSEFACQLGHLMPAGVFICEECGAPLASMDGKSGVELARIEELEEENEDE